MKTTFYLFTLFIILTFYGIQASVDYTYILCIGKDCRTMITTTFVSSSDSLSNKADLITIDNRGSNVNFQHTYSFSQTVSRSTTASASIGMNILGAAISASLGGSSSYSRTETFQYSVTVPPGKIGRVFSRVKSTTSKFRHVFQPQIREFSEGYWKKDPNPNAPMRVEYSYVVSKSPVFGIDLS